MLFLAEAPGAREAALSEPLVGDAGAMFNRLLYLRSETRTNHRLHNILSCQPPGNELLNKPWESEAIEHCSQYRNPVLAEAHTTAVLMGGIATRTVLNLPREKFSIKDFHGTVHQVDRGGGLPPLWAVPTFHPAHLIRGAQNLTGVMLWDLRRAFEIQQEGWEWDDPDLILDPEPGWFAAWVDYFLEVSAADPFAHWLAVDVETEDKARKTDEGDLGAEDQSYNITRINLSFNKGQGITIPCAGPWLDSLFRLLGSAVPKIFWNREYDRPRIEKLAAALRAAGMLYARLTGPLLDFMWAAHVLFTDIPRGLGFWAPLYLRHRPWKHLSAVDPVRYAAFDGCNTLGIAHGVTGDLQSTGRWDAFWRHCHLIDELLFIPSKEVGMGMDREALTEFKREVHGLRAAKYQAVQAMVPESAKLLHPKSGWKKKPKESLQPDPDSKSDYEKAVKIGTAPEFIDPIIMKAVLEQIEAISVRVCGTCGVKEVLAAHRCKDEAGKLDKTKTPVVSLQTAQVSRWYVRRDFRPSSPQQVLGVMAALKHPIPIDRTTGKPTTAKLELEKLARKLKDPAGRQFYTDLLLYRDYAKLEGTYADGMRRRLDASPDGRLHAEPTHRPSTLRTSYTNPNLQNITVRSQLGEKFRACFVAEPGCTLISIDFSGIEAVKSGWFMGDPNYIRLAWLGVHAYLCSFLVGRPADLHWSDSDLIAHFKAVKTEFDELYDRSKRCVHGTNYGLTIYGMAEKFPASFPSLSAARDVQETYYKCCPKLLPWHTALEKFAYQFHHIGGAGDPLQSWTPMGPGIHPYSYRHDFWDVRNFRGIDYRVAKKRERLGQAVAWLGSPGAEKPYAVEPGNDAKRLKAFLPQSAAAGTIKEAGLRLFHPDSPSFIGDCYHGRTPLRALVHDEYLLEVENSKLTRVLERSALEMKRAISAMPCPLEWGLGAYLNVGVEAKFGPRWAKKQMETFDTRGIGVAAPVLFDATAWEEVAEAHRDAFEPEWDPDTDDLQDNPQEEALRRALV